MQQTDSIAFIKWLPVSSADSNGRLSPQTTRWPSPGSIWSAKRFWFRIFDGKQHWPLGKRLIRSAWKVYLTTFCFDRTRGTLEGHNWWRQSVFCLTKICLKLLGKSLLFRCQIVFLLIFRLAIGHIQDLQLGCSKPLIGLLFLDPENPLERSECVVSKLIGNQFC